MILLPCFSDPGLSTAKKDRCFKAYRLSEGTDQVYSLSCNYLSHLGILHSYTRRINFSLSTNTKQLK